MSTCEYHTWPMDPDRPGFHLGPEDPEGIEGRTRVQCTMSESESVRALSEPMNGNARYDLDVWWTPDCGFQHAEHNPVTVPLHCPDDVRPDETENERV